MEEMSDWIKAFMATNEDLNQMDVQNVCKLITSNVLTVEKVVIDLGQFLTSIESKDRSKGVNILSQIINSLPNDFLSTKEVQLLIHFYCDRLKDHYSVVPNVFSGLLAIIDCLNCDKDLIPIIFNGLVKEISVQQFPVSQRFLVYQLLTKLFGKHSKELKVIKNEFILGLIQLIDGETDPRCLILIFHLIDCVIKSIDLDPFCEEVFEVISCYFPVIFSPPPNDEYGITKDDLSEALVQCFTSSPAFAEYLLPLVLDKLESELMIAKIDSFKVIANICPNYGYERIREYIPQLWTAIRVESFRPKLLSSDVSEHALRALSAISDTMASNQTVVDNFIELIWKDISNAFNKPELDLMESGVDIILAMISSNVYTFNTSTAQLIPILLKQFTFGQKESIRVVIIDSISTLLKHSTKIAENEIKINNFESLFTLLTTLSIADTESDNLRKSVILCLQQLVHSSDMNANHWKVILKVLNKLLDNCFESDSLLKNTYSLVESITSLNPQLIQKLIKGLIDDFDPDHSTELKRKRLSCTLNVFEFASNELKSFELIINCLVEQIKANSYYIDVIQQNYSLQLMETLLNSINRHTKQELSEEMNSFLFVNCFDRLIQHCIHVSICTDNKSGTVVNMKLMNSLFSVIGKGVSKLNIENSQQLFEKLLQFSTLGKVDSLLPVVPPTCFCTYVMGHKFLDTLNDIQALIVFGLIEALLSNLKYESDSKEMIELLNKLMIFAINDKYNNLKICCLAAKSIGAFVNRFDDKNEKLNEKLNEILISFKERLDENENSNDIYLIINALNWITKGLVIGRHSMRKQFIDCIISLVEHKNQFIGNEVSKAFEMIHNSDNSCLTSDNNAKFGVLYHQSFYYETLSPLLDGYLKYKIEDSVKKQNFLTALLTQLNYIPNPVFRNELNRLLPMLLDAISCDDLHTNQTPALDAIIQIMIDKNEQILNPSLKSTANNCVDLAINSPYLKVRRSALNCLIQIANTFDDLILNHLRDEVVIKLRKTLNDKKRIVRKSAVRARCKWILIGQPGK